METVSALTMWRYERWCCVYEPFSEAFGRLVVYSGREAVLEMPKVSRDDAGARATGLRALTQLATDAPNRRAG